MTRDASPAGPPVEHGPYADFQGVIDAALRKADPRSSIPWGPLTPDWAKALRPSTIADFGCATGEFTSAVLKRMESWGCLEQLETLFLVEAEPSFDSGMTGDGERSMRRRFEGLLAGRPNLTVELRNDAVEISTAEGKPTLVADNAPLPRAEFVIAAHFTYYFAEGGAEFLHALGNLLAASDGFAWLVVRNRECSIYRERLRTMVQSGGVASSEEGYGEDVEALVQSGKVGLRLVAARDQDYALGCLDEHLRLRVIHLLMWRETLEASDAGRRAASERVMRDEEALFSERHMIVRCALPGLPGC